MIERADVFVACNAIATEPRQQSVENRPQLRRIPIRDFDSHAATPPLITEPTTLLPSLARFVDGVNTFIKLHQQVYEHQTQIIERFPRSFRTRITKTEHQIVMSA